MPKQRKPSVPTPDEARRAIYIDFEGTGKEDDPPTLLGALWKPDRSENLVFEQYVFEPIFESAVEVKTQNHPATKHSATAHIFSVTSNHALGQIARLASGEQRRVFAWSTHDMTKIKDLGVEREPPVENAIPGARVWKNKFHSDVEFRRERRGGRNTLANYRRLIEYPVPSILDRGNVAHRIRAIREQLTTRGCYDALTAAKKRHWTKLLHHNWYDCDGMREVVMRAAADLESQ